MVDEIKENLLADNERAKVEAEWAKSKEIEAERMKAAQAINEAKPEVTGVAYLDPQRTKVRGWSSDRNVVLAKAEKLGTWGAILALAGLALGIISIMASVVGAAGNFELANLIIVGIPSTISYASLAVAFFFGLIATISGLYYKAKDGKAFGLPGWSGVGTILIVVIYLVVRGLIFGL